MGTQHPAALSPFQPTVLGLSWNSTGRVVSRVEIYEQFSNAARTVFIFAQSVTTVTTH